MQVACATGAANATSIVDYLALAHPLLIHTPSGKSHTCPHYFAGVVTHHQRAGRLQRVHDGLWTDGQRQDVHHGGSRGKPWCVQACAGGAVQVCWGSVEV